MSEKAIQSRILLVLGSKPGIRIFRNTVGVGRTPDGSIVRFGLCPGSGDLIGWTETTVTPEMVGRKVAVFTSVEVKSDKGKLRHDQENWLKVIQVAGGFAIVARSPEEAERLLSLQQQSPGAG